MKLKSSFVTHNTDAEHVMISVDSQAFSGLVRSNSTAAYIVEMLKAGATESQLVGACLERYEVDELEAQAGVAYVLGMLRAIDALDE